MTLSFTGRKRIRKEFGHIPNDHLDAQSHRGAEKIV